MNLKVKLFLCALIFSQALGATFDSASFNEQKPLKITRVTPQGVDVPAARQIVFQFNRPVVPLGRMERDTSEVPVTISPALSCQWRWINTSALACQLDEQNQLKQASRYTVTMQPGIRAEDGASIDTAYSHEFITQRPQIHYAWFSTWQSPGTPVVRLTFNQAVSRASVAEHLRFVLSQSVSGQVAREYPVNVVHDPEDRDLPRFFVVPGESYVLGFDPNQPGVVHSLKSDDDLHQVAGEEARRVWLVTPVEALPLDSSIDLKVAPGLVSAFGAEAGVEERTVVNFDTFPEFAFLGVSCTDNNGQSLLISEKNSADTGRCNPLQGVALSFSAPVLNLQIKSHVAIVPDLSGGRKDYDPWANYRDDTNLGNPYRKGIRYDVWLPERLKAAEAYTIQTMPEASGWFERLKAWWYELPSGELEDEFGRRLSAPIDLHFFTDHRVPNFELVNRTAVLEQQADSEVPFYVTNLDRVSIDYKKLNTNGESSGHSLQVDDVAQAQDIQFALPLPVREMLEGRSGAVYANIETEPHVGKYPTERILFATITPYQLHVKMGHYNSQVWVTDLHTGAPVAQARVQVYQDRISQLSANFTALDQGETDANGLVELAGTLVLDPEQTLFDGCNSNNPDDCEHLFVRVDKAGEMALMPLEYRFEVNTYRASNYTVWGYNKKQYGHIQTWGTTAQGLYRAGSTIQYKLYVRDQDNGSYIPAPRRSYTLEIIDPTGKTVDQTKQIELSEFGGYSGEFTVPENAAVGWYRFQLSASFTDDYTWHPLRVLVSDFTPAPFKVVNRLNGDLFQPGDTVTVASAAKLHSGGAYTDAELRVTATLKATYFSPSHPLAQQFYFDSYRNNDAKQVFSKHDRVDGQGEAQHSFTLSTENIVFGHLSVESAVRDERGKYIANSSQADFLAVDRLVGLKQNQWLYQEDQAATIEHLVVDQHGKPVSGTDVAIKIERLHTQQAKVKGAGNAYLTNYIDEWVASGECSGVSSDAPLPCRFTPDTPGTYKITASVSDTQGRMHSSETQAWVVGKGRVIWHEPNDDSLQIIAEKAEYNIGDRARYLIKNPYPGAYALVSIERYGVLKSWVQTLEGSTPVLEFEVEKDFMPGYYLSVIVVSPRVEAAPPAVGQIDLGKPAFKMGYVKVPVADLYKQIEVTVTTAAEVYKPRDWVSATLQALPKHRDRDEPIEIAVVVLDEAVLDLVQGGTRYFDPYQGFYQLEELDLRNFSLLTQLIGRQKFEKKGANPGGDGGTDLSVRSLFKYVSYWNPAIVADPAGRAEIRFQVPDNLTGWRILAFAVSPSDRMGLGMGHFKVNRPTEIRPVMPNQITEGDRFQAGFSVMNRSGQARDITVDIEVSGDVPAAAPYRTRVHLPAYQRQVIYRPVQSQVLAQTREYSSGEIRFTATARDELDGDAVTHSLPVHKRRSLETAANYGTTEQASVSESIQLPAQIHPDVGSISVLLSPSVIGNIDGAIRYVRDYPYVNWEQKLSKAVMASHYQQLQAYFSDTLDWPESTTLPETFLKQAANYQAPNGGMVYYIASDQYVSPYLSAYTALVFSWLRERNYTIPAAVESKLHAYLERLLRNDAVPSFYSRGMTSTVRAVALAALAQQGKITLSDLQRYQAHVAQMDLFGQAHYLQATLAVPGAEAITKEVTEMILAHASQSGGKFSFNEVLDDSYSRILATPLRANCSILSVFVDYGETDAGAVLVGDVAFKLVRSITQSRGSRDHWENTQENIFCLNALVDYSRVYEQVKPQLQVSAHLNQRLLGNTGFNDLRDTPVRFTQPIDAAAVGAKAQLEISRSGEGRLYYAAQVNYALLDDHAERINAGIDIRREYSVERDGRWVLLAPPSEEGHAVAQGGETQGGETQGGESQGDESHNGKTPGSEIRRGELVRVDLFVSLPTARNFVVVDDPVPGGLEPVNRDLANSSSVDAEKGAFQASGGSWWFQYSDWHHFNVSRWSFYHQELRHDAVRFYSEYLPAGNYHLSYTAQAIAEGEFVEMPVHAEEMYDPDVFGKGLPGRLNVLAPLDQPSAPQQ